MINDMESMSTQIIFQMQISLQDFRQKLTNDSIIFIGKDFDEESDLTDNLYQKNGKSGTLQQSYQRQSSQNSEVRQLSR